MKIIKAGNKAVKQIVKKYKLTEAGERLLNVYISEFSESNHYQAPIYQICKWADIDTSTHWDLQHSDKFKDAVKELAEDIEFSFLIPVIYGQNEKARRGYYQHGERLLKRFGFAEDKPLIETHTTNINLMDNDEKVKLYDRLGEKWGKFFAKDKVVSRDDKVRSEEGRGG